MSFGIPPFEVQFPSAITYNIETSQTSSHKNIEKVYFSWVQNLLSEYPELCWLADEKVNITQEGKVSKDQSPSLILFGRKYPEFDRTLLTLHSLDLIFDGSKEAYNAFTEAQSSTIKLKKESFDVLHYRIISFCKSARFSPDKMKKLMQVALVLGDMGKTQKARERFNTITIPDPDDFEHEAMMILKDSPSLCPCFAKLNENEKNILIRSTGLAHFGHIYHQEGGPEMFSGLKNLPNDPKEARFLLDFALFTHLCDVAGALGHVNPQSSIVFTQNTYDGYETVIKACHMLIDKTKKEEDAYELCLSSRAKLLKLDPSIPTDRVLTRVGAMLRLFSPEEGSILLHAFSKLSPKDQKTIIETFTYNTTDPKRLTPTYVPASLVNLMNNSLLGISQEERIKKTITIGLPILARVLEQHNAAITEGKANPSIRLCFNTFAAQTKSDNALTLDNGTIQIDSSGNVSIAFP